MKEEFSFVMNCKLHLTSSCDCQITLCAVLQRFRERVEGKINKVDWKLRELLITFRFVSFILLLSIRRLIWEANKSWNQAQFKARMEKSPFNNHQPTLHQPINQFTFLTFRIVLPFPRRLVWRWHVANSWHCCRLLSFYATRAEWKQLFFRIASFPSTKRRFSTFLHNS